MIPLYKPSHKAKKLMQSAIKNCNIKRPEELLLVLEKIKKEDLEPAFIEPRHHFPHSRYKE